MMIDSMELEDFCLAAIRDGGSAASVEDMLAFARSLKEFQGMSTPKQLLLLSEAELINKVRCRGEFKVVDIEFATLVARAAHSQDDSLEVLPPRIPCKQEVASVHTIGAHATRRHPGSVDTRSQAASSRALSHSPRRQCKDEDDDNEDDECDDDDDEEECDEDLWRSSSGRGRSWKGPRAKAKTQLVSKAKGKGKGWRINGQRGVAQLTPAWLAKQTRKKTITPTSNKRLNWKNAGRNGEVVTRSQRLAKPALWVAVEEGNLPQVRLLLKGGARIEESYQHWTPLMKAAEEGLVEILTALLDWKGNLEAANLKGRTALSFAAAPSMRRPTAVSTLRLLLERKADPTREDQNGNTALDHAIRENRTEAIEILKPFVASWKETRQGWNPSAALDWELDTYMKE